MSAALKLWNRCLFDAAILFVQMNIDHVTPILLGKIKERLSCRVGFYFVCQLVWYFTFLQSLFFLRWNYMCLGIEPLFDLSIFTAVDKVKDHILYNKVWKDNWIYWDTCQYWWKRQLNSLDMHVIFESIVITSYYKLDPSLSIFDHMNGSLFDEFTDYRLNISTYLLLKTTIIRMKNDKQKSSAPSVSFSLPFLNLFSN